MPIRLVGRRGALLPILVVLAAACSDAPTTPAKPGACELAAAGALQECLFRAGTVERACFLETGTACADGDPRIADALGGITAGIDASCADDDAVRDAGYGALATKDSLSGRLEAACLAETRALTARSFGGPQGAALAKADAAGRACLDDAANDGFELIAADLAERSGCLADVRAGEACDPAAVERALAQSRTRALVDVRSRCTDLAALVAIDAGEFVAAAAAQAQCLTALAHPDVAPLEVACGPRDAVPAVPRGQWTQVVLDESVFGTRCGDGSPYAFQLWLAPEGEPSTNVVVGMEGGGVCVFEEDCATRPADLFEALSDEPFELGPLSNDPSYNPFASWTKVFLPYCTQDVFIGGGATSNFPSITVHRYGAVNVRAALQYVRDLVWRIAGDETAAGYRAEDLRVLFGGFSAGGFGTLYNYHYVLDELQWRHTAAYPDAALALDNGAALGVRGLGAIAASDTPPLGWGASSFLPPYCFATNCGVGPVMLEATAPRLKQVPEQQFLVLTNQVDDAQVGTTFFDSVPDWINALRRDYCATRDLNGVHYYMPAVAESIHVISPRPLLFAGAVDGVVMRDWLAAAFAGDGSVGNQVVEGELVEAYPGVAPFPCPVAP